LGLRHAAIRAARLDGEAPLRLPDMLWNRWMSAIARPANDRAREGGGARRMANEAKTVRRILHFRIRTPTTETKQLLPFIKAAIPFYEAFGRTRIRLLHNVDDPTQFVQVVEYETEEAFEMNRQRIAGDPTLRAFLQTWRTLLSQAIEIDVYEDVTDAIE
jgi:hypothetical protein